MRRFAIAAAAALLSLALGACSSSSTGGQTSSPAPAGSGPSSSQSAGGIVIKNFAYSGTLTVQPGQKVTVTNEDSVPHTLTDKASHKFDTGTVAPSGGTATFSAPTKPGSYKFGCTIHPQMAGTLIVKG